MLDRLHDEMDKFELDGMPISSFDIWTGVSCQDRQNGLFNDDEYQYLTYALSTLPEKLFDKYTKPSSVREQELLKIELEEYVEKMSHKFLSVEDKNVQRALRTYKAILYNNALVEPKMHELHAYLDAVVDESPQSTISVLVPVSSMVESRWKGLLWIRFQREPSVSDVNFIQRHQKSLLELAELLYLLWYSTSGREFNMYSLRGVFCEKALAIATYLIEGCSTKYISEKLEISHSGVEYHIDSMKKTLMAKNRAQLIAELFRRGIVV